jgi:ribosomal protein S18 acetylase RimI-like enzyme
VSTWSRHDPGESHLHLGPIAVDPDAQGRHVGTTLMQSYCVELGSRWGAGISGN